MWYHKEHMHTVGDPIASWSGEAHAESRIPNIHGLSHLCHHIFPPGLLSLYTLQDGNFPICPNSIWNPPGLCKCQGQFPLHENSFERGTACLTLLLIQARASLLFLRWWWLGEGGGGGYMWVFGHKLKKEIPFQECYSFYFHHINEMLKPALSCLPSTAFFWISHSAAALRFQLLG